MYSVHVGLHVCMCMTGFYDFLYACLYAQVQPVVVQCFESEPLIHLRQLSDLPTMQLIGKDVEWTEGVSVCVYIHEWCTCATAGWGERNK